MIPDNLAILIDKEDRIIGYEEKLKAHRWPAPLHRAISIVIFNGDKILLQKRASTKPVWPLFWSNTCCANVLKGETYAGCAKRRLNEEMGIETNLKETFKFSYRKRYDKNFGEHELDHVFVGSYSGKVTPDPEEAADYKWVNQEDLLKDLRQNPGIYTPWFKIIIRKFN